MIITRLVVFDRSDLPENLRNNPISSVTLSDFTKEDNFDSTQIKNAKMVVFEDKGECKVLKNVFEK